MCHAAEGIISTCSLFSFFSGSSPAHFGRLVCVLKFDIASWLITNRSSLIALVIVIVVTSLVMGDSNGGGGGGVVARVGSRSVSRGGDGGGVAVGVGGHGGSGSVGGGSHGSGGILLGIGDGSGGILLGIGDGSGGNGDRSGDGLLVDVGLSEDLLVDVGLGSGGHLAGGIVDVGLGGGGQLTGSVVEVGLGSGGQLAGGVVDVGLGNGRQLAGGVMDVGLGKGVGIGVSIGVHCDGSSGGSIDTSVGDGGRSISSISGVDQAVVAVVVGEGRVGNITGAGRGHSQTREKSDLQQDDINVDFSHLLHSSSSGHHYHNIYNEPINQTGNSRYST